jgi:hypothetical protein
MRDKSSFITGLRLVGRLLPGDYLKTTFYLRAVAAPRRFLRLLLGAFYRMDHVYEVIRQVRRDYRGTFAILEFGTADGYAFTKMLYATRYLGMDQRVVVHGFDTFDGLPPPQGRVDQDVVTGDDWVEGEYRGGYGELEAYCSSRYHNYRLHRGFFEETLTDELLATLHETLPILVWIDCDYYSSARTVIERLVPHLPSGCVIYFDDYDTNYGSRLTGEARVVHELNSGVFGEAIELVLDPQLSLGSRRIYRFVRLDEGPQYEKIGRRHAASRVRRRTNDSPLP